MPAEKILMISIACFGAAYALLLARDLFKRRESLKSEKGSVPLLALLESGVFFIASWGVSDFAMNTPLYRKMGLVDDARLPGTLTASSATSSALLCLIYLSGDPVDFTTLILCVLAQAAGVLAGVRLVSRLSGNLIRAVMGYAMLLSILMLFVKTLAAGQAAGGAARLAPEGFFIALPVLFVLGMLNMLGFGMKAPAIALLLLLGMDAKSALTVVMTMACFGSISGGIQFVRRGNYQRKIALAASLGGAAGILGGTFFVKSVSDTALFYLMLALMAYTAFTLFHPRENPAGSGSCVLARADFRCYRKKDKNG